MIMCTFTVLEKYRDIEQGSLCIIHEKKMPKKSIFQ